MSGPRDTTLEWDASLPPSALRQAARVACVVAFLALLGYCLWSAWTVLGQLASVKLADVRRALDVVSVRDTVLCLTGYRVAIELLRAVTRRS